MATRAKELSDLGNSGHLNVHDDGTVTLEGGNVGIGTTSPSAKLHVSGTAAAADNSSSIIFSLGATVESYVGVANAGGNIISGSAQGDTVFRNNGGNILFSTDSGSNAQVYIKSNGNVGIGTDSPTQPLEIKFSDNTGGKNGLTLHNTSTSSSGAYSGLVMKAENATVTGDIFAVPSTGSVFNGGALLLRTQTNHPMVFQTNSSNRMTILANGNVVLVQQVLPIY